MSTLVTADWLVIAGYFAAVFGLALIVTGKKTGVRESSAGYFLAGRNVGWVLIGTSLFASNIGSEHLIGLAGAGAKGGVAVGQFELLASLILIILAWVFVPFYLRSGVYTMPEFLERRYSSGARTYLAVISVIAYVLTKISVTLAAGGILFKALLGMDFWTGAIIIVVITGVYTIFGGLRAVLYTELLQTIVLIGGALAITFIGLNKLGGWSAMCETAGGDFLTMWKANTPGEAFPWTGILFGAPILGVWYWCTDQYIVQRVLSARNIDNARVGALFGGYLKILPLFIFVVPGIIAFCLAKQNLLTLDKPDEALPTLIKALLPAGLRGLVVAGFLAALMSSLSSVFNSCSTVVTWDIYRKLDPKASEKRLVLVGQLCTVLLVGLGLAWIPFMKYIQGELYAYLQSVQAYVSPPVAAVFLLGLCWKRLNAKGAMTALLGGFVLGALRLILELNKGSLSADGILFAYADINFLHFAIVLFAICSAMLIVVSLLSRPMSDEKLQNLTFQSVGEVPAEIQKRVTVNAGLLTKHIVLTVLLVLAVLAIWWYFSPWGIA